MVDVLWGAVVYACEFVDDIDHPSALVTLSSVWHGCEVGCVRLEDEFVEWDMCECLRQFAVLEGEYASYAE